MAWYSEFLIRYRGRLISVSLRYGRYNGATVVRGKPLQLSDNQFDRDPNVKRIMRLAWRKREPALSWAPDD